MAEEFLRADLFLVRFGYADSREKAQKLIEAGNVKIDGVPVKKSAQPIPALPHEVTVTDPFRYVGRGGEKCEGAIREFGIEVAGKRALDVGASTGGFTDCLLQHGAAFVVAVDSGSDQLAPKLKTDARVRSMERTNARNLTPEMIGGKTDLIVMDVSFISATYLIPLFPVLLKDSGEAVVLIKPQFEVGKSQIGKGGIVKDPKAHRFACEKVIACALASGLSVVGLMPSPIAGGDGNREFLVYLRKTQENETPESKVSIERTIPLNVKK